MIAHAHAGFPDEACGLLGGTPEGTGELFVPTTNADASSRTFTIDGPEQVRAERQIEDAGLELIGVVHSHTHTDAYPSPTDVAQAPDPSPELVEELRRIWTSNRRPTRLPATPVQTPTAA